MPSKKIVRKKKRISVRTLLIPLCAALLLGVVIYKFGLKRELPGIFQIASVQNAITGVQAELGTATGGVAVRSDSSANGGQYIEFSNLPTASPIAESSPTNNPAFQPSSPYYATFYYMWYKAPSPDGGWSYWSDHGGSPPNSWFSHYLPDPKPGIFDPASELYSANNYDNFKWQVSKMKEAKMEVAIASWWGPGTKEDTALNNVVNNFMARADNPYPSLRWAVYYEDEGFANPSVDTLVSDLNHLKSKFGNSPYMLRINGKPVVFVYAGADDTPGTMVERWSQAISQTGNSIYYVLKVFPGYKTVANQPSSWHQYAPAVRTDDASPYSYMVSPGFWLDDGSSTERLPRDPAAFEDGVKKMVASSAKWKLVETWNEWGEGTSVEPGIQVQYNSGTGKNEIKPGGYQFGNLYIDILNRNLPALEAGSTQPASSTSPSAGSPFPSPTTSAGGDPVIVAAGDIVCGAESTSAECKQMDTSNLIAALNPAAVLLLGDNQYEKGALADWQQFYDPSWGRFKNITFPSVGNHEYLTPGAAGYFDYFNGIGANTGRAGDRGKGYYAYNVGTWRLYSINSNCTPAGGCGVNSPQYNWLKADLAANPKKCTIAYFHHPVFASGSLKHSGTVPLLQLFYDAGGELVLNGHEHFYERFAPQDPSGKLDTARGFRQIIVGTGGRNFTGFNTVATNSEVRNNKTYGVLKLTLHPSSYDLQFINIPSQTGPEHLTKEKLTNEQCH